MESLIENIKKYFSIEEFVSPIVYRKYGEGAWKFIDYKLLENMLYIREALGKKITVNNWAWGGKFSQRGYRENVCTIVKQKTNSNVLYASAHTFGKAADFDVEDMTAAEVRAWIFRSDIPHKCRLENNVSWVHLDIMPKIDQMQHVYLFNA